MKRFRALGQGGAPGPVYLDFPVDTLRAEVPRALQLPEHFAPKARALLLPDPAAVQQAVELLWSAHRPRFVSGRGARGAGAPLTCLLDRLNGCYLDTGESRGLMSDEHPAVVAAMRGSVMSEADLVVTVGRRLDFQLAYGSPAVFGEAKFIRIADGAPELRDNRRGAAEIFATPAAALEAILAAAGDRERLGPHDARQAPRTRCQAARVEGGRATGQRRPDAPEPSARRIARKATA